MKSRKYLSFFFIFIAVFICGCATRRSVTHEALETIGFELFSNFRFYISKDITLTRIVTLGENLEQIGPGLITVSNEEVNLRRSIVGRFQNHVPPDRLEIAFEELPDGKRPTLTFVRDVKEGDDRYYIETTRGEGLIVDAMGTYGYIKVQGDIVLYNGLHYFITFIGTEKPFLRHELDVTIVQERREIRGLR